MSDPHNIVVHTASVGGIVGALFGWLPPFIGACAAGAAFIWYVIQIIESETFKRGVRWWVRVRGTVPVKPKDPDQSGPELL